MVLQALQLYKKGLSLRSIAEIIGTNNVTMCDDLDVIEIDEMCHYIKKITKIMDLACLLSFPRKNYCL